MRIQVAMIATSARSVIMSFNLPFTAVTGAFTALGIGTAVLSVYMTELLQHTELL